MSGGYKKVSKIDWLVLGVLGLATAATFFLKLPDNKLHVWFLDVGQGDAIFVQAPDGWQVLIDGGPDETILRRLGEVMPFYDKTIDIVVLTHPDSDHLAGLVDVLERYKVPLIFETGMACPTSLCVRWEETKEQEQSKVIYAYLGQEMAVGDNLKLLILHPFQNLKGDILSKRNNGGIVLKLIYGQQSVLLTADIEKTVENKLVVSGADLDSDFLKIAHHGSKTSTTESFLKAVSPLAAFIGVGAENRYGHPTAEVLSRLENSRVKYYRTDSDGTVELVLDGQNYEIIE